jgi:pyrimidine-specific ribonucleoside hydrolase
MRIAIETDIGRDPDDFFALCYLAEAGCDIAAVAVSPGDPDQISVAKFLLAELGSKAPVGQGKPGRDKSSATGMHVGLLERYKYPPRSKPDGTGADVLASAGECDLFVIGPLTSVGELLAKGTCPFKRATMQGGFCSYDFCDTSIERLEKFEGKETCATFNLNGDKKGAELFMQAPISRRFVSKNVCHTVVYGADEHCLALTKQPKGRGGQLLREGMALYLSGHPEGKKFHDPTAAACMLHPEIAKWARGRLFRRHGEWGFQLARPPFPEDEITVDLNHEALWNLIAEGT